MSGRRKGAALLALVLVVFGGCLIGSQSHWLMPHSRTTCDGHALVGARVYRSRRGEVFLYAPNLDIQPAVVSPKSRVLERCNAPAFTPVFGLLFSREAEPNVQCNLDVEGWRQR